MSGEAEFIEALMSGAVVAFGSAAVALGIISENAAGQLPRQRRRRTGKRMEIIEIEPSMKEWSQWLALRASLIDGFTKPSDKKPNMKLTCGTRVRIFAMPDFETAHRLLQFSPSGTAEIRIGKVSRFKMVRKKFSADVFGAEPIKVRRIP